MGKHFLISALALAVTAALLAANAHAQESVPGDACTTAGLFRQSSGADPANGGYTLFCDGTRWIGMIEYRSTGDLYFSSTGAVALPDGTTAQRPAIPVAGMIRYNATLDTFEGYVDDGTPAWENLLGGAGGALNDLSDAMTTHGTDNNLVIGHEGTSITATSGLRNLLIGRTAGDAITTGDDNVAVGFEALTDNTTADGNTALGYRTLHTNTTKTGSVAVGFEAMRYADSAAGGAVTYNTALGSYALRGSTTAANNTGIHNTALGPMPVSQKMIL